MTSVSVGARPLVSLLFVALVAVGVLVATTAAVLTGAVPCAFVDTQPACEVVLLPGPTEDTLGLVEVDGARTYPSTGELLLTTVAVQGDLDLATWWEARRTPEVAVVSRETVYPSDVAETEVDERNARQMEDSQQLAVTLALDALGSPIAARPGRDVDATEDRPVDVRIDAGIIGGPSAGLMFALGVVELLGSEDLTGGAVIAGTGVLADDGAVLPIGGVRQKVTAASTRDGGAAAAATVFLVPEANLVEASAAPVGGDLLLVPVTDLDDAIAALTDLRAGREPLDALALAQPGP